MAVLLEEEDAKMPSGFIAEMAEILADLFSVFTRPGEVLSILTLLGLVLYASTWLIADVFWSLFSVKPEEVGISYISTLTRLAESAPWIAITGLAIGLLLGSGLYWYNRRRKNRRTRRLCGAISIVGAGIALVSFNWLHLAGWLNTFLGLFGAFAAVNGAVGFFAVTRWLSNRSIVDSKAAFRAFVWANIALVAIYFPSVLIAEIGESNRAEVITRGFAARLLNVTFSRVSLEWVQGERPKTLPADHVYFLLGSNGDIFIIYDGATDKTYRVNSQMVILEQEAQLYP